MDSGIEIREVAHGSEDYQATVVLRRELLREPLGLEFDPEQLAREDRDIHIGAFHNGMVVGCLVLSPADDSAVKMRQVAVATAWQGRGIGRELVQFSESAARRRGFCTMVLHARKTAVPFYTKLKYNVRGSEFVEVTIPHMEMWKSLAP